MISFDGLVSADTEQKLLGRLLGIGLMTTLFEKGITQRRVSCLALTSPRMHDRPIR